MKLKRNFEKIYGYCKNSVHAYIAWCKYVRKCGRISKCLLKPLTVAWAYETFKILPNCLLTQLAMSPSV